jgi:predicted acyl esterase
MEDSLALRGIAASVVAVACLALAPAANADIAGVFGGDVSCSVQPNGVRFCGSTSPRSTTKTFDGVPIDVNAAFPPAPASGPDGPYPLIMLFHGYGGSKLGPSAMQPYLDRGYATFSMTDRGFGESCGSAASRTADPAGCAAGYIRLMDDRYEVRDAQLFAGELVDAGLVDPNRIGAVGGSYGGGASMALAALKDRTMLPDGSLVPWRSPNGTPMRLAAAAPNIPWTDLAASLEPNGSTLDYVSDAPYRGRVGVDKKSLVDGLYLVGCALHFCAPPGADPDADLTSWKNRIDAGEPYDGDPTVTATLDEVTAHHSSYYIDHSEPPAPLLISNGFTDDLFPVDEAIRFYNRTKTQYPKAPVSLFFGDFGHPRAQNKADVTHRLQNRVFAWFDHYVKGSGPMPFQGVIAMTETCPSSAPSGGPFYARDWAAIAPGEVRFDSRPPQTISATAGDLAIGKTFDPVLGGGACATAPGTDQPGVASYRLPAAPSSGYTLIGAPTVIARFSQSNPNSQVAARLLDVAPDGTETLVARGLWRPRITAGSGRQVFQLHPNGWRFAPGHVAKLELLPNDAPYGRPSNGQGDFTVSNLELRLPVRQKPGALGGFVKAPAPKALPPGYHLAPEFEGFGERAASLTKRNLKVLGDRLSLGVKCPAKWRACDGGKIVIRGAAGSAKFVVAKGPFRLDGGSARRLRLNLSDKARRYFRTHGGLRVRASVDTSEQAKPSTSRRKVIAG